MGDSNIFTAVNLTTGEAMSVTIGSVSILDGVIHLEISQWQG